MTKDRKLFCFYLSSICFTFPDLTDFAPLRIQIGTRIWKKNYRASVTWKLGRFISSLNSCLLYDQQRKSTVVHTGAKNRKLLHSKFGSWCIANFLPPANLQKMRICMIVDFSYPPKTPASFSFSPSISLYLSLSSSLSLYLPLSLSFSSLEVLCILQRSYFPTVPDFRLQIVRCVCFIL